MVIDLARSSVRIVYKSVFGCNPVIFVTVENIGI